MNRQLASEEGAGDAGHAIAAAGDDRGLPLAEGGRHADEAAGKIV
jgi:hypothetical protein